MRALTRFLLIPILMVLYSSANAGNKGCWLNSVAESLIFNSSTSILHRACVAAENILPHLGPVEDDGEGLICHYNSTAGIATPVTQFWVLNISYTDLQHFYSHAIAEAMAKTKKHDVHMPLEKLMERFPACRSSDPDWDALMSEIDASSAKEICLVGSPTPKGRAAIYIGSWNKAKSVCEKDKGVFYPEGFQPLQLSIAQPTPSFDEPKVKGQVPLYAGFVAVGRAWAYDNPLDHGSRNKKMSRDACYQRALGHSSDRHPVAFSWDGRACSYGRFLDFDDNGHGRNEAYAPAAPNYK